jgi:hypothetical protein
MSGKKKIRSIISCALTLIMVFSMSVSVLAAAGDTAGDPLPIANNPVIPYGSINPGLPVLDPGWDASQWIKVSKTNGVSKNSSGASFKALYDENYLYVMTQVFDTNLDATGGSNYTQDSVEIFTDIMNNKATGRGYTDTDFQFRVNYNNITSFDHGGNNRLISATRTTKDANGNITGYIVESVFYVGDLKKLAGSTKLGFDIQVNGCNSGNRDGQWCWFDNSGNLYQRPALMGTIIMGDKPAAVPSRVDRLPLFQSIISAQKIDKSIYDNSSIIDAPLAAAITMYYNTPAATQAQVDATYKALSDALFALNRPGAWPDPKKLPKITSLPDLFTFMDGTKVKTFDDWKKRQAEISDLAQYYQYGYKQPAPTNETFTRTGNRMTGTIVVNGITKTFTTNVTLPNRTTFPGQVPVVVAASGTAYTNAGIATTDFNTGTWADEACTNGIYFSFFPYKANDPKLDTSCIMAWAWGYSRVVDGLLSLKADGTPLFPELNPKGVCVEGFSINGKFALAAGAFDNRTAVTIPCNSGEGGVSNWRKLYNGKFYDPAVYTTWGINPSAAPGGDNSSSGVYYEYIKNLVGGHPGWFNKIFSDFQEPDQDAAVRLPYDQHSIIALCASEGRSVIIEGGFQDWGTNPQAMFDSYKAAKKAWDFQNDPRGIAITFDKGGHGQTTKEINDIVAFINYRVNHVGSFNPLWQTDPYVDYDASTSPWNAPMQPISVTTNANLIKQGDYFDVKASFLKTTTTNAVSMVINYDSSKFEYAGNLGADPSQGSYIDGVTCLKSETTAAGVAFVLMIPDYKALDLVSLRFRAKEDANIQNADYSISAYADFVSKVDNYKYMMQGFGSTDFTTSGVPGDTDSDGKVTLMDLSNVIDMFGVKKGDVLWTKAKFYDFNKNNAIDIADIVSVAKLII